MAAGWGFPASHLKVLADLDGDALPAGGGEVGLVDTVGVGLDPEHGRARILGGAAARTCWQCPQ